MRSVAHPQRNPDGFRLERLRALQRHGIRSRAEAKQALT